MLEFKFWERGTWRRSKTVLGSQPPTSRTIPDIWSLRIQNYTYIVSSAWESPGLCLWNIWCITAQNSQGNFNIFRSCEVRVAQSCLILCDPMDDTVHAILQTRILEWIAFPFCRGSCQPRDLTQVSCIAGIFFTAEPSGKPKNTGVGSLSLLQGIFLTQNSNKWLLHCSLFLYQLSCQGSPKKE